VTALLTRDGCPKHMVFGPCGGVDAGGGCEVDDRRCVFVDTDVVLVTGGLATPALNPRAARTAALMATRPVVVADFPGRAMDINSTWACADILAGAAILRCPATLPRPASSSPPLSGSS
jgi:hypothetical protein